MRTTVQLPDDLLKRAKKKAAADGRTLTSLIEEGLKIVLANKPRPRAGERVLPRVSKAAGGFQPGLDPVKSNSETQELEDIEMLERVRRMWAKA